MKNRYFQFLRGILIIFVVVIHVIFENDIVNVNYFNITLRSIINCCVALFIFISAYFVNEQKVNESTGKYIVERGIRLIVPLLIWNIIYGIVYYMDNKDIIKILKCFIQMSTSGHLYYIAVLFQLVILTPLLIKLIKNKNIKRILYLITPIYLVVLLICKVFLKIHIPFYQYFFFGWIIYYLMGLEKNYFRKGNFYITVIMVIISILGNNYIYYIDNTNYSYACSQLNILNMFYVISLIPIVMNFDSKYKTTKKTKILENIGDYSYGIYFIHMLVLRIVTSIINNSINILIYYIIVTMMTVFFSYIFIKVFKKITKEKLDKYLGF